MAHQFTIPGGRDKGKAVAECDDKSLQYWSQNAREDGLKAACSDELSRRASGGGGANKPTTLASQPAAPGQAMVLPAGDGNALIGAFADPGAVTAALMQAQQFYHVVTPAMSVGGIPEGCEIYTSLVTVDPLGPEVYNITGDRRIPKDDDSVGIDKVALAKIWAALGGSWQHSRRVDSGNHPHYCAWEAAGLYQQFDGQVCRVLGNVDIDVREPLGAAYVEIVEKAKSSRPQRDPSAQLLELRKFLPRHCESKAMNKAIANVGIRRSYKRADLRKPFLVARLAVTGRTDNPRLREDFARMHYAQRLNGTAALYGASPALPAPAVPVSGHGEQEFETRQPVTYSMPQPQLGALASDIETHGEPGSDPNNEKSQRKSEPPPSQATSAQQSTKPNYAEGEADL